MRQRSIGLLFLCALLGLPRLWGQFSPPGSPRLQFEKHGIAPANCPYILIAPYRVHNPFYLTATNMLLDHDGDLLWYQQVGFFSMDFQLHANGRMAYNDNHYWHILDSTLTEVDSVICRNGYHNDIHDFRMMADGHYFLICIEDTVADLSGLLTTTGNPGAVNGRLDAVVIQELDASKQVVREWHGRDHYTMSDPAPAYFTNPAVLELNHTNSIDLDGHGKMLLSHRALNEIAQIDWATGQIDWHLGGNHNDFVDLQGNAGTIGQHDARYLPNGRISTFDNGNFDHPARGIVIDLDTVSKIASLAWQHANDTTHSDAMGSMQAFADGSALIGFGRVFPTTSAVARYVTADCTVIFEVVFPDSCSSYRVQGIDLPFSIPRPQINCAQANGQAILGVDGIHLQYQWNTGENSSTIVVSDTGWYQAFVPLGIGMVSTPRMYIADIADACRALSSPPAQLLEHSTFPIGRFDLLGRPLETLQPGTIYLERFKDGSCRKRIFFE